MVIYVKSDAPPGNIRLYCKGDEHDDIRVGTYIAFVYPDDRWSGFYRITGISRERRTIIRWTQVERAKVPDRAKIISMIHVGEWDEYT